MEFLYSIFIFIGIILLIAAAVISNNKYVFPLILMGLVLILVFKSRINKMNEGKPAYSLNALTNGEKYEVMHVYEKYIIIKSIADNEKLKFIGPLDFGTITTGKYVKTAEKSLEKIE